MKSEVSIIIPVYNAENYLETCLDSIAGQGFEGFEAICINDGSKDASSLILHQYARRDSRFKVIDQQNRGAYPTRNAAIGQSKSRYIIFVDSDDMLVPDLLEKVVYRAEADKADITLFGYRYMDDSPDAPDVATWNMSAWRERTHKNPFPLVYGYTCNKLYRKAFLDKHHLRFPECFYSKADLVFHWKSMSLAQRVSVVPEALYLYRRHENSITGTIGRRFIQVIDVMETIRADLKAIGDPKGMLPIWGPFAFNFIYSGYCQMPDAHKPEMSDALRSFVSRLTPEEQRVFREPGHLPKNVRCFFLSLETPAAGFLYGRLFRNWADLSSGARKILLPDTLKNKVLDFLTSRSYRLRNRSEPELRNTLAELNDSVNRLAAENYRLRRELSVTNEIRGYRGIVREHQKRNGRLTSRR